MVSRDVDRGFAWFILAASFFVTFVTGLLCYSTGVINTAILEEVDSDISRTSWIGSSLLGTFTLSGPLAGICTKALGYRISCICGGILVLVGLSAASFINNIVGLIATYGIVTGLGLGLAMNSACAVPGYYFLKRRSLAFGVAASGAAVGMFAGGPLSSLLLEQYRLHGCLLILGALASHLCVAGCIFRPIKRTKHSICPTDYEREKSHAQFDLAEKGVCESEQSEIKGNRFLIQTDSTAEDCTKTACDTGHTDEAYSLLGKRPTRVAEICNHDFPILPEVTSLRFRNKDKLYIEEREEKSCCISITVTWMFLKVKKITILNKYGFFCYCFSVMLWTLGEGACLFHLPNYAQLRGSTRTESASLFTAMGITSLASRLLAGCASHDDSIRYLLLHTGLIGMAGVLTLLFPLFSYSYVLQMIFAGCYGLYSGGPNSLISLMSIELVGLKNLAIGLGVENFFIGIGFFLGPPIASMIYSVTGNYDYTFIFSGGVLLAAAFSGAMMTLFSSISPLEKSSNKDMELNIEVIQ